MTSCETERFIEVLPCLVETYNSREHRMIGMSLNEAEKEENANLVRERQEENYMGKARKTPKFKEGATVRISKLKGQFDRGFDEQFHEEIFKIKNVFTRLPIPTYQLETFDGEEIIEGNFYGNELTAVNPPQLFKIEKIIRWKKDSKTGEKLVLVKWRGYQNPSWTQESDVVDV